VDPFDGQPLRYSAEGAGYVLYSVGPDLKDDAGERTAGQSGDNRLRGHHATETLIWRLVPGDESRRELEPACLQVAKCYPFDSWDNP